MPSIRNQKLSVHCQDDGQGFGLTDLARGTNWQRDEQTMVCLVAGESGKEQDWVQMKPFRAEQVDEQTLEIRYNAGESVIVYRYRLHADYVEVQAAAERDSDLAQGYSLPGSFVADGEQLAMVLPIMQGMLWKGKGDPFEWRLAENGHGGFCMPLIGYLGSSGGLLVTAETRDDANLWLGKDERNRCWASFVQLASLGAMRYTRTARIYATDADHVAIAKVYRNKVISQGRFRSWEEKIAERPALERLFGALMCFIGYCQDDIDYVAECAKLKQYGFDKALVYPARFNTYHRDLLMGGLPAIDLSREEVAGIKALGYDVAPWSWVTEALDDGTDAIRSKYRTTPEGAYIRAWSIDDQHWNKMCTTFMGDYVQASYEGICSDMTWDHFDVIATAMNGECHTLDHPGHYGRPMSKSEDREFIRQLFLDAGKTGRPISSEGFIDAYADCYDMGSVKAFPMFYHWPFWPIPLTSLVYHDSMMHTWWEIHNYNNPYFGHVEWHKLYENGGGRPRLQAAMDALYGAPPDVFPFGSQYMWSGRGNETFAFKYRFEDPEVQHALREALPVARLHGLIGKLEMIGHRFLSEDGNVQETVFSDGTRVIANFAGDLRRDIPGIGPLQAESWIVVKSQ